MDALLLQRIKDELGEVNPAYIELLLKKSTPDLLQWLEGNCLDTLKPIAETRFHAMSHSMLYDKQSTIDLGLNILVSRFEILAFICKELKARNSAFNVSVEVIAN